MYIHGKFINQQGNLIAVHILTGSDRDKDIEIGAIGGQLFFSADDPVSINSQVNDTFDVLLCRQATITLQARGFVPELFGLNARDVVVNIYRDSECIFAGFVEPHTYSQGFNEVYDDFDINCVDALTALQYTTYGGDDYMAGKALAGQRTFYDLIVGVLDGVATGMDIVGGHTVRYCYDGSKALDNDKANRYNIFKGTAISDLLFFGDDEEDAWTHDDIISEILKYLNLHLLQVGFDFYIFSWDSVKDGIPALGNDLKTDKPLTSGFIDGGFIDIGLINAADTDTSISIGDVYNKLSLTCQLESLESLVKSPLDSDDLTSPYANRQLYVNEYYDDTANLVTAPLFLEILKGIRPMQSGFELRRWFIQVKDNSEWQFNAAGVDLIGTYAKEGKDQQNLPNALSTSKSPAAAIISFGEITEKPGEKEKDNSLVNKIDMTDYLVISVNGNGNDTEAGAYPTADSLQAGIPCAVYKGSMPGGSLSPTDKDTTNYLVISGCVLMNAISPMSLNSYAEANSASWQDLRKVNYSDGQRFYLREYFKSERPNSGRVENSDVADALVPPSEDIQAYEFKYSAIGDASDHVSKVAVLACMLIIGDKCVVETGTAGQVSDFTWAKYKTREECANDDEYYAQSFTVGFDPKIGDKLIGTNYDIQNNISYKMGLDAEGMAIPIKSSDHVSGKVQFSILGPVNTLWDDVTRRHPTFFRHTKWSKTSVPLLAHVSSIFVKDFEIKIYSDNGLVNNTDDSDLVYTSDTDERFVNKKDDIEFKINSALTTEERMAIGMTDVVRLSTPVSVATGDGVLSIYDYNREVQAKPEQLYVDSYYTEYHQPRVIMTQRLIDAPGNVSPFRAYRHPAMPGKTFFVQSIDYDLMEGSAQLALKENYHD